jgi:hypothetical protein
MPAKDPPLMMKEKTSQNCGNMSVARALLLMPHSSVALPYSPYITAPTQPEPWHHTCAGMDGWRAVKV